MNAKVAKLLRKMTRENNPYGPINYTSLKNNFARLPKKNQRELLLKFRQEANLKATASI